VEGDSAASEAVKARDSYYQEILRMRGKILNVYTAKNDAKIYANEEVKSFLQAVGYDPTLPKGTPQNYRVGRVIIMADEDVDGNHISVLVLLLILKKLPDMIEKGMVHILLGSLYTGVDRKNKRYYADTLEELQAQAGPTLVSTSITRMKGWGEAQKEWLIDLAFGDNAKLMKVLPSSKEDIEKFVSLVSEGDEAVAKRFALLSRTKKEKPSQRRPLHKGPIRVQGSRTITKSFRFSARYRQV
jgi:DNA gyrase subunit B